MENGTVVTKRDGTLEFVDVPNTAFGQMDEHGTSSRRNRRRPPGTLPPFRPPRLVLGV